MGKVYEQIIHRRGNEKGKEAYRKMLNIRNRQKNAKQIKPILLLVHQIDKNQRQTFYAGESNC